MAIYLNQRFSTDALGQLATNRLSHRRRDGLWVQVFWFYRLVDVCAIPLMGEPIRRHSHVPHDCFNCPAHMFLSLVWFGSSLSRLVHCDGTSRFADFLEQKCERCANQTDQDAETKSVNVTEKRTLLLKDVIENCERFLRRRPVAGVARERALDVGELLLKIEIKLRHVPRQSCLARLCVPRD